MIKYVIFDLGEVLINGTVLSGIKLAEKHNIDCETDPRLHTFPHISHRHPLMVPMNVDFMRGSVTEDEYVKSILGIYPELGTHFDLKQYIRDNFTEIEGTRGIILKLKGLGYKLGLLSVHGREWIAFCEEKFSYRELFDELAYSYEDGIMKPDTRAFIRIMKALGADPEECLFIDDSPANISAAEALGMKGIVFTNATELQLKLEAVLDNYKT